MSDVAVMLIQNGNYFAFLERVDGTWTFPSGKVEPGEEPEQAALREAKEEAGLETSIIRPLSRREVGENTLHYFLAVPVSGTLALCEPEKFNCVTWATAREICMSQGDKLFPAIRSYFETLFPRQLSMGLG